MFFLSENAGCRGPPASLNCLHLHCIGMQEDTWETYISKTWTNKSKIKCLAPYNKCEKYSGLGWNPFDPLKTSENPIFRYIKKFNLMSCTISTLYLHFEMVNTEHCTENVFNSLWFYFSAAYIRNTIYWSSLKSNLCQIKAISASGGSLILVIFVQTDPLTSTLQYKVHSRVRLFLVERWL